MTTSPGKQRKVGRKVTSPFTLTLPPLMILSAVDDAASWAAPELEYAVYLKWVIGVRVRRVSEMSYKI